MRFFFIILLIIVLLCSCSIPLTKENEKEIASSTVLNNYQLELYSDQKNIEFSDNILENMTIDKSIYKYTNVQGETIEFDIGNCFIVYNSSLSLDELAKIKQDGFSSTNMEGRQNVLSYGNYGSTPIFITMYYSSDSNRISDIIFDDNLSEISFVNNFNANHLEQNPIAKETFDWKIFQYVFGVGLDERLGIIVFNNNAAYVMFFENFTITLAEDKGLTINELKILDGKINYNIEAYHFYSLDEAIDVEIKINLLNSLLRERNLVEQTDNPTANTFITSTK